MRRKAIIALVFIVAAAVLIESWHAAMNAAATGGRPWPWLWPATLEAFIAVLVLVYWDARSGGQKAWTARVFLIITTAVASAVQILDAPPTPLGRLTAGWTPVALLLSIEFAVGRLYGAGPRPDWPLPDQPVPEPEGQPEPTPSDLPVAPKVVRTNSMRPNSPTLTPTQVNQVRRWVGEGRTNKSEMARELKLSDRGRRHLGRLVDELRDQPVRVGRNGDRP